MSRRFDAMYARVGRPSIPPEQLLRAQSLQMLYSEIDYNLLFRWFVGLNADDKVWDATVFTKNRDRLPQADVAREFLAQVVEQARAKGLTSDELFTVDGTLLEVWAGAKSFRPNDKRQSPPDDPSNPTVNFRGQPRSNETHESKTDPEALLARKLPGTQPVTVGGDKGFDTRDFVKESRRVLRLAENARVVGESLPSRGVCVDWIFTFACAAYNLVRMRNLAAAVPAVYVGPKCALRWG